MRYSKTDLAAALPTLRPALIRAARRFRRCSWDDAEDLVSQTVLIALRLLPEVEVEGGRDGLRRWLRATLNWVIREDRKREARQVETAALEEAVSLPAPDALPAAGVVRALFRSLPPHERILVNEWLAGYDQRVLARRHRLHRNTVANRLESAFASLRTALPNANALTYSGRLLEFCSRVSIYAKPRGVWPSWFQQHPPELSFARYRRLRAAREKLTEETKEEEG